MGNTEKMTEMLRNNPELQDELMAEIERLAEADETLDEAEALGKAAKTVLGIDLTKEDMEALAAEGRDLSLEELDAINGGSLVPNKPGVNNRSGVGERITLWSYRVLNKLGIL